MIKYHRLLLSICLTCCLPLQVFAAAPVVDDSENFAILDEQQASVEPVAKTQLEDSYSEDGDEVALAKDSLDNSGLNSNDNTSLLNRIQNMQQEMQELRGQLEVQAHDIKRLKEQQLAFYKDIDARLSNNSTNNKTAAVAPLPINKEADFVINTPHSTANSLPATATAPKPFNQGNYSAGRGNPADEQLSYMAAYELVKNKRFDDALTAMQAFVVQYPQGGYTANAQYWLGELYMVKSNYNKAINHFEVVLKQFPNSTKAAASTLKIGYALLASNKPNDAKKRLQEVVRKYPDTPTAQLALMKLESINAS